MDSLIKIRKYYNNNSIYIQLPVDIIKKYELKEVVFDYRNLIIRKSCILDNKTYKISGNTFGGYFPVDIIGEYNFNFINEDEIELKRV